MSRIPKTYVNKDWKLYYFTPVSQPHLPKYLNKDIKIAQKGTLGTLKIKTLVNTKSTS
jgi:hypothetical protein